jgi:uncharacterized protein (TIGR03435 family)
MLFCPYFIVMSIELCRISFCCTSGVAPELPSRTLAGDGLNWTLDGTGVSVGKLATSLSRSGLDRPVFDRTGLTGGFDLYMKWAAEVPASTAGSGTVDDPMGLSIFAALKEQLGLKLESTKGSVETLVIDHVEKPSEN